ncbi:hypothetical protein GCM10011318_22360 [Phaeocystidibacter marisrubri]|nr:hypothetical protein GCM10011318_22360 [Phaeocystidibacter marisrubri]
MALAIFARMKRMNLTLKALLLASGAISAQSLEVSPSQLQFGYVLETTPDSLQVMIHNKTPNQVDLDLNLSREVYGDDAFRFNPNTVSIAPLDSTPVWVVFSPIHNVDYSGNILFADNGPAGAVSLEVNAQGRYSKSYYAPTENLNEEALKSALNTLLAQNYSSLSYDGARDQMYGSIDNVGGDVECVYTGRVATFNDRPGANANNFNCEHTFPQGFFNSAQPMRSDIHHLYPTDAAVNSRRNNHPFGMVANPSWTGGGSKYGNSVFEPRDAHKGAAARAMLYFVIRYQDYQNFFAPQEAILKAWNEQFTPSAFEKGRNDDVYAIQNNRNPFVDYPQMVRRINNFVTNSSAPVDFELSLANDTLYLPVDAQANHNVIFRTAVLNTGNQPVFVQPFPTGLSNLNYTNGTDQPETLLPGEGKVLELIYSYSGVFNSDTTIRLATNLPSGFVNIPIRSTPFALSNAEWSEAIGTLYPNPANDVVYLPEGTESVEVFDVNGRVHYSGQGATLHVSEWIEGVYTVRYKLKDQYVTERLVVTHL